MTRDPSRDRDPLATARRPERIDLDAVQARVDAATEGPWAWELTGEKDNSWAVGCVIDEDEQPLSGQLETGQGLVVEGVCEGIDHNPGDAEFIAHARTDVPDLVTELRAAREAIQALRDFPPLQPSHFPALETWWNDAVMPVLRRYHRAVHEGGSNE